MPQFTEDDVGKTVINPVGDEVGIVEAVEDGVPYVDPHPDWSDRIKTSLGWGEDPDVTQTSLQDEFIDEVTEDHVKLREDLHVDRSGT